MKAFPGVLGPMDLTTSRTKGSPREVRRDPVDSTPHEQGRTA